MNQNFYETGSTQPPGSRIWIVLLLVMLIFISGIITTLGILNIRLWSLLTPETTEAVPLSFTRIEEPAVHTALGFEPQTISAFHRNYYHLPQGVYIPRVQNGSNAALAGVLPGDILVSFNGQPVADSDALQALVDGCNAGDTVSLTLLRDGNELTAEFVLQKQDKEKEP